MPGISAVSGKSGVAKSNSDTLKEAKKLKAQFLKIPDIAVKQVIAAVYPVVVKETVQDSGKAAYNWWIGTGKARRRFYIEDHNIGPIGLPGEKRSNSGAISKPITASATISPQVIVALKVAYMQKFIRDNNLTMGATIYNQTPESDKATFKGTYAGNANIRVAMAMAEMEAEAAVDKAGREFV